MTNTRSPLRRFVIFAVALVVIAALHWLEPRVPFYTYHMKAVITGLYLLWVLGFAFQLSRALLYVLITKGKASALMISLYEQGIFRTVWEVYRRKAFQGLRLSALFLLWSLVIFGIVAGIAWIGALDNFELRFLRSPDSFRNQDTLNNVRVLTLVTEDNNPTKYLRNLAQIVDLLRKAGARLVVATQPWMWRGQTSTLIDSLRQADILILCEQSPGFGKDEYVTTSSAEETQRYAGWRVLLSVNVPHALSPVLGNYFRWYPFVSTGSFFKMDASLAVAAHILGFPDSVKPVAAEGRVFFGNLTVPVSPNGEALSVRTARIDRLFLSFGAIREGDADTMSFFHFVDARMGPMIPGECEPEIRGKIVVISWYSDPDRFRYASAHDDIALASIIESLLQGKVFAQYGRFSLLLTAVVIGLSALLCYRIQLRMSVSLVLALGIALFVAGVWIMPAHFVLLNIAYPTVAAILSAVIFPLVRLSHENPI